MSPAMDDKTVQRNIKCLLRTNIKCFFRRNMKCFLCANSPLLLIRQVMMTSCDDTRVIRKRWWCRIFGVNPKTNIIFWCSCSWNDTKCFLCMNPPPLKSYDGIIRNRWWCRVFGVNSKTNIIFWWDSALGPVFFEMFSLREFTSGRYLVHVITSYDRIIRKRWWFAIFGWNQKQIFYYY